MWVSFPTLCAVLGKDMGETLCANRGGVPMYVPRTAHTGHELAKIIGLKGMEALCAAYKGEYITVPASGVRKEQILRMLSEGRTKREIALACGVTERYVYQLAGLAPGKDERQLTLW